jgi:hypothetical protein
VTGVRPGLAGRSAAPPVCTDGSGPCAPPLSRALACWRMRDAELSTLNGRLLDECLRIAVQVPRLGR